VENRFTGSTAYANMPIDGTTVGLQQSDYLSRSNFTSTYPKTVSTNNSPAITTASKYVSTAYDDETMPETGANNGLFLATLADGTMATLNQLNGSGLTDTSLEYDDSLVKELAEDYDSDTWELLLDQMTTSEMKSLVELGGFGRSAVQSIGMPRQYDYDGPAGFNTNSLTGSFGGGNPDTASWTAFPSEALMACSWSESLMFELGRSMGAEADATSCNGWYAPGVNLHRSAYISRNYEYYSEDGVLSGKMAAMVIYGAKTNGLSCYLKHFVCHEFGPNNTGSVWLTEQNLRENYLKPFEIAVKEGGANGIMTAFNRVGAVWAGANYSLLTDILRNEWGFKGAVITDWTSGQAEVGGMNVNQGVRAGNDLWLCPSTGTWTKKGASLDTTSAVDMACARRAAHNILYMTVDTRATFLKYKDANVDDIYSANGQIGFKEEVFPWWKPVLFSVDGVVAVLFVVWLVMLFKPQKDEQAEKAKNATK
jgi:beta-glucosidase